MPPTILLNNQKCSFKLSDLPCLIHGKEGEGSSLFTVSLVTDLFRKNEKTVFLCGYKMAYEEFISQTQATADTCLLKSLDDLENIHDKKMIFVTQENVELWMKVADLINDRMFVVKNFDLFNENVLDIVKKKQKFILSGNLDRCIYSDKIIKMPFQTKVLFSQPSILINQTCPPLQKYYGYMWKDSEEGEVYIKQ